MSQAEKPPVMRREEPFAKALAKFYPARRKTLQPLVLYNSRDARPGEVDGVDYDFRSREQVENLFSIA